MIQSLRKGNEKNNLPEKIIKNSNLITNKEKYNHKHKKNNPSILDQQTYNRYFTTDSQENKYNIKIENVFQYNNNVLAKESIGNSHFNSQSHSIEKKTIKGIFEISFLVISIILL